MDEIVAHYRESALLERIMAGIERAGIDVDDVTVDDLAPVDEFHVGGRAATASLLGRAGIPRGRRVLDIGSGVGGTARYLAATGDHAVLGVDLTPEYVDVARALTRLTRFDGSVRFVHASVLDLPLPPESFDAAVLLHVGMNIVDKDAAFAQVARVLVDGGTFAIYDIMGASDATLGFPMPWASSAAGSFLATASEYIAALESAGFAVEHVADRSEFAQQFFAGLRRSGPPPPLGLHLLMGDEAALRYANMVDAVKGGIIAPTEIVALRRSRAGEQGEQPAHTAYSLGRDMVGLPIAQAPAVQDLLGVSLDSCRTGLGLLGA